MAGGAMGLEAAGARRVVRGAAILGARDMGVGGLLRIPKGDSTLREIGVLLLPVPELRGPKSNEGISASGGGGIAVCVQGFNASATSSGV